MVATASAVPTAGRHEVYDVLVYGGTSSGVIASVQVARMGKHVLLVSPERHLGGLTSNGLGWVDAGRTETIGGLSREFFQRVYRHNEQTSAWKWESRSNYAGVGQGGRAVDTKTQSMWTFEPHVAESIFQRMIVERRIPVVYARLDQRRGVLKRGAKLVGIQTSDGRLFAANTFIDCSYEGDLMRLAGASYTVGRESNDQYGESIDGLQVHLADKNQLPNGISGYRTAGKSTNGLLPGFSPTEGLADGSGDRRIQAYCYRMCLTDEVANRVPVEKPAGYRESDYELLFRAIAAGQKTEFFKLDLLPNRKTDSNNSGGISTDYIGQNYGYPQGSYEERKSIASAHRTWQIGLLWTLQKSPKVPRAIREFYSEWGLPKDEFVENDHWPYEMYIRESIRLVGEKVITEKSLRAQGDSQEPIGMGSYTMDSHNVQRTVRPDGTVMNEGDVQVPLKDPYSIDYRALLPREFQCSNLIVPVCLSATHIAYGSIRMEPVFMILGQSAATAAVLSLETYEPISQLKYEKLESRLIQDGQILRLRRHMLR